GVVQAGDPLPLLAPFAQVAMAAPTPAAETAPSRFQHHALGGWLAGQAFDRSMPDTGAAVDLSGRASLAGLGPVFVGGHVQGIGFIAHGAAHGTVTLTDVNDPRSQVTLELTGPDQGGLSPLPTAFAVRVTSATGRFAGLHEVGTFKLSL